MMWREKFIGEFLQLFGTLVDYDRFICEDFRGVSIFFLGSNVSFPLFLFFVFFLVDLESLLWGVIPDKHSAVFN